LYRVYKHSTDCQTLLGRLTTGWPASGRMHVLSGTIRVHYGYCVRFNVNHSYLSTVNEINLQQCMNYMVSTYNDTLFTTAAAKFSATAAVAATKA